MANGIKFTVPMFSEYEIPNGYLIRHPGCHALMYYALTAMNSYKQVMEDHVLDDAVDPHANFRELFKSISKMYGVDTHDIAKFWPNVRLQFKALNLEAVPRVVEDAAASHFVRGTNDVKLNVNDIENPIDFEALTRSWKKLN